MAPTLANLAVRQVQGTLSPPAARRRPQPLARSLTAGLAAEASLVSAMPPAPSPPLAAPTMRTPSTRAVSAPAASLSEHAMLPARRKRTVKTLASRRGSPARPAPVWTLPLPQPSRPPHAQHPSRRKHLAWRGGRWRRRRKRQAQQRRRTLVVSCGEPSAEASRPAWSLAMPLATPRAATRIAEPPPAPATGCGGASSGRWSARARTRGTQAREAAVPARSAPTLQKQRATCEPRASVARALLSPWPYCTTRLQWSTVR
mmetsp:Transcript_78396/g.239812  ORF Transcript_78396/g.239812 Transcript_78396/m.239812 type:complete len:259 (-) Transcript_78396:401-1177(-)